MATRYSDYERGGYGRRYLDEEERGYRDDRGYDDRGREGRGMVERATDEVRSWFGDPEAERRRRLDDYRRPNERTGYRGGDYDYGVEGVRARDVMTRDVARVRPDDPIERAARLMEECDCGALPVIDRDGRLLGMVTDRDITVRLVARGMDLRRARVYDCMTDEVFACHASDSVTSCMRTMSRHQVRRVPIVDDRDRLIGIVSQGDLARHAGDHQGYGERRAVADVLCAVSEPGRAAYR